MLEDYAACYHQEQRLIQLGLILGENASAHTPVWDILNGRQEEDDDFTTGSKKVKRLQMWTLNQMGRALNLDTATHGYVTMGREVTSLSFSILICK